MRLSIAATLASLLVHPIPIEDWEPPPDLLTGCVRPGFYTHWDCTGLGPTARAHMPDAPAVAPPPHRRRHAAKEGLPAELRAAATRLERGIRDNDAAQINAARAAVLAALARMDAMEGNHK
jgi:hypothetical protein